MIDFTQVKSVQINEGLVKYITLNEKGRIYPCYWKRPLNYPAMGFSIYSKRTANGYLRHEYQSSYLITDKYGITRKLNNGFMQEPDLTVHSYEPLGYLLVPTDEDGYSTAWLGVEANNYNNTTLGAYKIVNETQLNNFPANASIVSDAEWILSDKSTGKINLYATPDITSLSSSEKSKWDVGNYINLSTYDDYELNIFTHDTDITVAAGTPIISLSKQTDGTFKITVRTNIDDYKNKYDTATAGKYPKNQYPYLRATVILDCKSTSLGIQTVNAMYITVEVRR